MEAARGKKVAFRLSHRFAVEWRSKLLGMSRRVSLYSGQTFLSGAIPSAVQRRLDILFAVELKINK